MSETMDYKPVFTVDINDTLIFFKNVANKAVKKFKLMEGEENYGNEVEKANAIDWVNIFILLHSSHPPGSSNGQKVSKRG